MIRLVIFVLSLSFLTPASAKERWLDLNDGGVALVISPDARPTKLPALVMLPYTDGTSTAIFSHYSQAIRRLSHSKPLVVVMPPGSNDAGDYDDAEDWRETISEWEEETESAIHELVGRGLVDPKQVVLAGHSMGGDLAWAMSLRKPSRYRGALVMGSRCSWRPHKAIAKGTIPRQFLVMGVRDRSGRQRGMHSAARFLSYRGEHFLFRQHDGGHQPAPELVFLAGLNYLYSPDGNLKPPAGKTAPRPSTPAPKRRH